MRALDIDVRRGGGSRDHSPEEPAAPLLEPHDPRTAKALVEGVEQHAPRIPGRNPSCYSPAMDIKYRIGVMPGPWPGGPAGSDFLWRFIDLCERSGIDSVWFSERLSSPIPVPEPMTTMAAVAARTRRLKFGPSVLIAPFRSPVVLAREIAMIDYLSGGRMLPALGVGVELEREFRAAGVPFKERGRRTDEAIQIMRRCWAEDEVTGFSGEFWSLERVTVLPRPTAQQPFPVWIGGNSEAAMRRAGRLGDGSMPRSSPPEQFRVGVEKTQAFAAEAGREVPTDHFGVLLYFCFARDPATAEATAPGPSFRETGWTTPP